MFQISSRSLQWPWPVLGSQNTGIDTYKCQIRYTCRFVNFVCARYFARQAHQARKDENIDFDLTCDVISDLKVKCLTLFGEFTSRAIEWRLKFGNRSSSLGNLGGRAIPPPPQSGRIASQTPSGRGLKDIGFLSPFLHKNRTDFNNTTCYPCLPSTIYFYRDSVSAVVTPRLLYVCQTKRFPKLGLKC